ncbi:hypothetical protein ACSBR2_017740 [Camellia fascicularis]
MSLGMIVRPVPLLKGFNNLSKHKEVIDFVKQEDIKIMSILETKIKMENEAKLFKNSFKNWKFLSNSQPDLPSRIWICWDPNFCDILVTVFDSDFSFFSTFVYVENKHDLRLPLFCDLKKIAINHASHPSIFLGDFNVARFSYEKMGGKEGWSSENDIFNSMILDSELEDLCYKGCQFTWSNKCGGGNFITSKIDRVLVNERWLTVNPNSYALFLPPGVSDHSPVIVHLGSEEAKFKKRFKFFDFWADHVEFLPRVHGVWRKYIRGSPMFRVCQKLKTLKPILKDLNKKEYSEISTRVGVAKDHLLNSQIKLDKDPMNLTLQEEERAAYVKYVDLSKAEESLAHQKSRVQWLGLGDRNSKFFFRTAKGNVNRGRIHSVVLPNGDRMTKSEDIHNSFVDYFTNLFGKPFDDHYNGYDRIRNLVTKRVSEAHYQNLARKVIRSIESLFRDFFWSRCELKKYRAKVSWDRMCSPKNEGGLGFKSLTVWSKAAIAKHVWFLFSGDAKVSEIVEGTTWRWPFPSSWELMDLIDSTPSTFLPTGGSDDVSWCPAANGKFTIQSTWNSLRQHFDQVNWSKIIWGPHNIPKVSFVVWMAILGRLNTGERLKIFGVTQSAECVFCQHPCEDHNHLFFECPFSERVWTCIKGKINVDWPSIQWNDLIHLIAKSMKGKSLGTIITKLAFTCTVYQLWIARNNRVFSKDMVPEEVVIKCIVDMVRFRVMHITNLKSHHTDKWYLSSWRLPHTMLKLAAADVRNVYGAVFPK